MIHITLGGIEPEDPAVDPLGRSHHGWKPGMTDEDCYASNRGRWVLGARADRERYALLSATDEGRKVVVLAIEMVGPPEDTGGGRRALRGRILRAGHPVYDQYVGGEAPVRGPRNPVTYFDSPLDTRVLCGCGCGEILPLHRDFLPGHDQRAIHERIARVGGVREFLDWFDKEPPGRPVASPTRGVAPPPPSPAPSSYVNEQIVVEIRAKDGQSTFNVTKLLDLITELNQNYARRNTYASHVLLRAILDHVPPIFGHASFGEVASNYSWGRTDRKYMKRLSAFRDQADDALHRQISPKADVLDFNDMPASAYVDRLLQECTNHL